MSENRAKTGKFLPGISGNPGGRPAAIGHLQVAARERSAEAIECLTAIMRNGKAPAHARVAAARELLDRAWGKPAQSLELSQRPLPDPKTITDAELLAIAFESRDRQDALDAERAGGDQDA